MAALMRAILYATIFVGLVLVFLPARTLSPGPKLCRITPDVRVVDRHESRCGNGPVVAFKQSPTDLQEFPG